MRVALAVFAALVAVALAAQDRSSLGFDPLSEPDTSIEAFDAWRAKYADDLLGFGRDWAAPGEYEHRYKIWTENLWKAYELSHEAAATCHLYDICDDVAVYGPTKFSDLAEADLEPVLGLRPLKDLDLSREYASPAPIRAAEIPDTWDWRFGHDFKVVGHVHNQGACGSCWAFATVEHIESAYAVHKKQDEVNLSEAQLIDCDIDGDDHSCHGGWMTNAYDYIIKAGGLMTYADYSYRAFKRQCQFDEAKIAASITGYDEIKGGDQASEQMAQALYEVGPLPVAVDATPMLHYHMGTISGPCSKTPNHGVVITGYHEHSWKVRNSWGESWGERGYCSFLRGHNTCAIEDYASYVKFE